MTRTTFALIFVALAILIFVGMWWGWKSRSRRDQSIATSAPSFTGELLATFSRIMYVSTTEAGAPLDRIAAPGLRYRGFSEIQVFADGVEISVTGENPVRLSATSITGTTNARVRVGKAVERNGLTLLQWSESGHEYESTFRFEDHGVEREFVAAIDQLLEKKTSGGSAGEPASNSDFSHITQEDAR